MANSANIPILIPSPNGPYAVGYSTASLTDSTRKDPFDAGGLQRRVMISLFYPIERSAAAPPTAESYMPPLTSMFLDAALSSKGLSKVCHRMQLQSSHLASRSSTIDFEKLPLVLFSPGLTFSRHQYNAMAQSLASEGYAVVSMDHPWEAMVIEWPDGTNTRGNISPTIKEEDARKHQELLDTRVADACFVLDQLELLKVVQQLVPNAQSPFNKQSAAIFGHSLGGATAVSALMRDSRFKGAMNMDGSQYGPLVRTKRPVVLFGRGEPDPRNRFNNPTWQKLAEQLDYKREINLRGSAHNTFSDLPLVFKLSGIPNEGFAREMAGILDGELSFKMVTKCIRDFADLALKGKRDTLFEEASCVYPEIEIVREACLDGRAIE